jgi:UPF0755 protein
MSKKKKRGLVLSLLLVGLAIIGGALLYRLLFTPVSFKDRNYTYIYVETGDELSDLVSKLNSEGVIEDSETFSWLAARMSLGDNIHPGKYRITSGMTMRRIVNLFKYNKQEKVKVNLNSQIHDLEEFIEYVDQKLELSDEDLEDFLTDEKKLSDNFGLDPSNSLAMLIPGSYEVSWAVTADDFFRTLKKKYDATWNADRKARARNTGYTIPEIITIASIVQSESGIASEQKKIAGVYINRLKKGMPLQADPTLKFANRNFGAQRIYDKDKEINSPYNTYRFKGLPPGPICLVTQQAIDATLNYERHNYIFFCASSELNGLSHFSSSYEQHQKHARAYQKALDKLGIRR